MNREYVIVCNRHKGQLRDCLVFWGERSNDDSPRSFSGYTIDIDKCERYTLEDLDNDFEVYGRDFHTITKGITDYAIKVDELLNLGFRRFNVIAK